VEQYIDDPRDRAANPVVGRTFSLDDLVGRAADVFIDLLSVCLRQRLAIHLGELIQAQAGNGGLRPREHF